MTRELTCDLHQRINISATILKSSLESASGSFSHLDLQVNGSHLGFPLILHEIVSFSSCLASLPVVVHITDQHGVKGIKVPAEDSKLVQDEELSLLSVPPPVGL